MSLSELIAEHLSAIDGPFVAGVEAEKFLAHIEESAPTLLADWLHENARRFLANDMREMMGRERRQAVARAKARAFGKAAADEPEILAHFAVVYVVDEDDTRRRVADMTGADHRFVASEYEASAKNDRMLAAFHRAVAKKVNGHKTSEVLTEEQYDSILRSIVVKAA